MHAPLDRLALADLSVSYPQETLDEVADLVLRRHQLSARNAGALLTPAQARPYLERGETERLGMRSAVVHVLHALLLLDLVELRGP
ncbi:MAG: hypothetical protein KGK07_13650 [Chloroflexota bacterium]|nr:hypothetical protein [Chloroflexota bacterium]